MRVVYVFSLILLFPALVFANESSLESFDNLKIQQQQVDTLNDDTEDINTDGFVNVDWSVDIKEQDLNYFITLRLSEDDLPSKAVIAIFNDQIKITLENKVKFIKIPQDVDPKTISHQLIEDMIKFKLPKKKFKSII